MKMRTQIVLVALCMFALAACGGAENEAASPDTAASSASENPATPAQPVVESPSAASAEPARSGAAAQPVQSGNPVPAAGPAPAACRNGVVISATVPFSGSQQEWLSGTTTQGTDGVHYWFSHAREREACACAGCTADRCQAAESAPSHTVCR